MRYSRVFVAFMAVTLLVCVTGLRTAQLGRRLGNGLTKTSLYGMGKEAKRAWAKEDLQGKDMFDDDDGDDLETMKKKQKFKLEPETVFYEGPPSASEVLTCAICVNSYWYCPIYLFVE